LTLKISTPSRLKEKKEGGEKKASIMPEPKGVTPLRGKHKGHSASPPNRLVYLFEMCSEKRREGEKKSEKKRSSETAPKAKGTIQKENAKRRREEGWGESNGA